MPPAIVTLLKILAGLAAAYLVVVLLGWRFQERLAFPSPRGPLPAPAALGIAPGERITVRASDGVESLGWYLPPEPPPRDGRAAPVLVWFYGNMETIGAIAPIIRAFRPPDMGLLVLDYRGYGENPGPATEAGLYRDAEAAWDYLARRGDVDAGRIAVYGRSLGSAVALHLATHRAVSAVVLDSPFSSAAEMAARHYWFLPQSLVRLSLDNVSRASRLEAPLLVFHGARDRIAPLEMGRAVAEAGRAQHFVVFENAGHNDTYDAAPARYRETMHEFLGAALR